MNGKILIVDDEKSMRITLEHFLLEDGHEVMTASDYDEALDIIGKKDFDLIILDILLGGMTGIDLLQDINKRNVNCPVIMITGAPNIKTAVEAVRHGAFEYLTKPVNKQQLLHVTGIALRHKSLTDEKEKYRSNLETIFKNINEGVVTVDNNVTITEINGAAYRICGFSRNIVGKTFDSIPVRCNGKCTELLNETINSNKPLNVYRHECRQERHPGRVVTLKTLPIFQLNNRLSGAMLVIRDETRIDDLERDLQERTQFHNIIGKSSKMQRIYSYIENLADVLSTVLITGESGTGKDMVAEALHYKGNRRDKRLVKVNCSALSENLLESELFGHIKGAFTGAIIDKVGRFEMADGGTIFLDEIGDISTSIQLKLLRVLQEKEFERVGDSRPIKVNVRVVAATNHNLHNKVMNGDFREDLYYRLKVVELTMPPLREHRDDIPLLVNHFLQKFSRQFKKEIDSVSENVMELFMEYTWPGNVREMEHALEHAFVICKQHVIAFDQLPQELLKPPAAGGVPLSGGIGIKSEVIRQALAKCGWNKSKAARILGISRPTIYRKIKENRITEH
jgi:PAS domain S-box-containing protein